MTKIIRSQEEKGHDDTLAQELLHLSKPRNQGLLKRSEYIEIA